MTERMTSHLNTRITTEQLVAIRQRAEKVRESRTTLDDITFQIHARADIPMLLDEISRLRQSVLSAEFELYGVKMELAESKEKYVRLNDSIREAIGIV